MSEIPGIDPGENQRPGMPGEHGFYIEKPALAHAGTEVPGLDPGENQRPGMPGEHGFYIEKPDGSVPQTPEDILKLCGRYGDTITQSHEEDIYRMDNVAAQEAWYAAADIASAVEKGAALTETQRDLLSAMEAHAATFEATAALTDEQNGTLNNLDAAAAAAIVDQMVAERSKRAESDPAVKKELAQLQEYSVMLKSGKVGFDVADIDRAVDAYKGSGQDPELTRKVKLDVQANTYFAKYAREIGARSKIDQTETAGESAEANEQPLSRGELIDRVMTEELDSVLSSPGDVLREVEEANANFKASRLDRMKALAAEKPTPANRNALTLVNEEATGFAGLIDFAQQWKDETEAGKTSRNFRDYLADLHQRAQAEESELIDKAGGRIQFEPRQAAYYAKVESAYKAGFSRASYGLEGRLRRRLRAKVLSRVNG